MNTNIVELQIKLNNALIQIGNLNRTRENALARTKLEECIMWLERGQDNTDKEIEDD